MAQQIRPLLNRHPRVLLADDHRMLLEAFRGLLEPHCTIVGAAYDGHTLVELAAKTLPDIVILDIAMPRLNGLDASAQLRRKLPEVKIIFLTVSEDPEVAAEAIRQGASAFLLKSSASSELISAIELALAGKQYVTPLLTKGRTLGLFLSESDRPEPDKLTARQREVLQLLAEGRSMKEAAEVLKLTPRTVAFHKYTMMEALGLKTGAELVQYAVEHRIVAPRS